ncbi:hypothetical protein LY78DRAFT_275869 [Colletotrichum sublineola]|nr:hypothetical protein LY78DRAFT_275869 [Colletotrichum sublineola]
MKSPSWPLITTHEERPSTPLRAVSSRQRLLIASTPARLTTVEQRKPCRAKQLVVRPPRNISREKKSRAQRRFRPRV